MQSAVESVSDLGLKINISVPANELEVAFGNKVNQVAQTAKVDGFRKGKVPVSYVKKIYGKSIQSEVVDELVRNSFNKVCQEKEIAVAGVEKVDVIQQELGKDLEFCINVETYPVIKFEDSDFSNIEVEKLEVTVSDSDVKDAIEKLRKSHADWQSAAGNAKAKMGDKVVIDFSAKKDGEDLESGSATDFDLELGSKHLIPGFEEGVVGHKAGDEFVLDLTFPEDYHAEELAAKEVKFTVTLKDIKRPVLPEINEEFCAKFGIAQPAAEDGEAKDLETLLNEKVKESLEAEAKQQVESRYKNDLFNALRENKEIAVPNSLVEAEISDIIHHQLERYRSYVGNKNATLDLDREGFREQAQKNVHLRLLVRSYIQENGIKVDREMIKTKLSEAMGGHEISEDLLNWYYSEPQRLNQIEALAIEDLVTKSLETKVKVKIKKQNFKDLVESAA